MDGSDRLDLADLRARDWLAEDAELAGAEAQLADLTAAKAPKARLDEARRDLVRAAHPPGPARRRPQGPRRPPPRCPLSRGGSRRPGSGGPGPGAAARALRRLAGQGVHPQPTDRARRQDRRADARRAVDPLASSVHPKATALPRVIAGRSRTAARRHARISWRRTCFGIGRIANWDCRIVQLGSTRRCERLSIRLLPTRPEHADDTTAERIFRPCERLVHMRVSSLRSRAASQRYSQMCMPWRHY